MAKMIRPILPTPPLHAVAPDVTFHHWSLGFKQSSLDHITRALQGVGTRIFLPSPLPHHALVPEGFTIR